MSSSNDTPIVEKPKPPTRGWREDVDGDDHLSSDERLIEFLLMDNHKYLDLYMDANKSTTDPAERQSMRKISDAARDYFVAHGVSYRAKDDLRHRMRKLIKFDYVAAYYHCYPSRNKPTATEETGTSAQQPVYISNGDANENENGFNVDF